MPTVGWWRYPEAGVKYEYNSSGQLIKFTRPSVIYLYSYPNTTTHNYSQIEYTSDTYHSIEFYEYDEKVNPYKDLPTVLGPVPLTDNNIVSLSYVNVTKVSTYEYNPRGYPISRTTDGLIEWF
jgi:hypothetical protein